jgi:hypothetical protein
VTSSDASCGRGFDPDRLALLELKTWKAYYRRQPARLFALLVRANREQAAASTAEDAQPCEDLAVKTAAASKIVIQVSA